MDFDGELIHLIMQAVRHVSQDVRPGAIGHAIDYDPTLHAIRLVAPGYPVVDAQGNLTGEFGQTGWVQVHTMEGHQAAPHIGDASTYTGDQYWLFIIERGEGTAITVAKTYNDKEPPPFQDLQPGEWGYKNRDCGSYIRFHQNGFVEIVGDTGQKITFDQSGDQDGSIRIQVAGQVGELMLEGIQPNQNIKLAKDGSVTIQSIGGPTIQMSATGAISIIQAPGQQIFLAGGGQLAARNKDPVTANQDGSGGIVGYVQATTTKVTVG